jgi:hypothetical protein
MFGNEPDNQIMPAIHTFRLFVDLDENEESCNQLITAEIVQEFPDASFEGPPTIVAQEDGQMVSQTFTSHAFEKASHAIIHLINYECAQLLASIVEMDEIDDEEKKIYFRVVQSFMETIIPKL